MIMGSALRDAEASSQNSVKERPRAKAFLSPEDASAFLRTHSNLGSTLRLKRSRSRLDFRKTFNTQATAAAAFAFFAGFRVCPAALTVFGGFTITSIKAFCAST
jgi:hypothetical protein